MYTAPLIVLDAGEPLPVNANPGQLSHRRDTGEWFIYETRAPELSGLAWRPYQFPVTPSQGVSLAVDHSDDGTNVLLPAVDYARVVLVAAECIEALDGDSLPTMSVGDAGAGDVLHGAGVLQAGYALAVTVVDGDGEDTDAPEGTFVVSAIGVPL